MTKRVYTGDAPKFAKKLRLTLSGDPGESAYLKATIGRKSIETQSGGEAVADKLKSLLDAMATEWNASTIPEFAEITATSGQDANKDPFLDLEADEAGVPFDVTFTAPRSTIDVDTVIASVGGNNEIQTFYFVPAPTGGTYTISWDPGSGSETSATINWDDDAAAVKAAIVAGMASVTTADVDVTGSGTSADPFTLEFKGDYANTNVNQITVATGSLQGGGVVTIETLADGNSGGAGDDIYFVNLADTATGKFVWSGAAEESSTITAGDSAASVKTAIVALSGITTSDVDVFGGQRGTNDAGYLIRFKGALRGANLKFSWSVVSGDSWMANLQVGGGTTAEEYVIVDMLSATAGTFTLTDGTDTTSALQWNDTAATIATELVSDITSVTSTSTAGVPGLAIITINPGTDTNQTDISVGTDSTTGGVTVSVIDGGVSAATDEVKSVYHNGTGGTFTLSLLNDTTDPIPAGVSTDGLESLMEALSSLSAGDLTITGSGTSADPWIVVFGGTVAGSNISALTGDGTLLTGAGVAATIATPTAGSPGTGETQHIIIHDATGGNFQLTFKDKKTGNIAFGATAATVETALEALASVPSASDVAVSGSGTTGDPYVVTFSGNLLGDIPQIIGHNEDLTGPASITVSTEVLQASGGPGHWGDALNWIDPATGNSGVPVTGDDVYIMDGDAERSLKYDMDQSAVSLNSLYIHSNYSEGAQLGLEKHNPNGYEEYRERMLKVGLQGTKQITIGAGDGGGSDLLNINTLATETILRILGSAGGARAGEFHAIQWIGTHASNVAEIIDGDFGAGVWPGETYTIATLTHRGGQVFLGSGGTVTNIDSTAPDDLESEISTLLLAG